MDSSPLSDLTLATKIRAALSLDDFVDRSAAFPAGLCLALIDKQFLTEIAWLAVFSEKVAQCGAALCNGVAQHVLDRIYQFSQARQGEFRGRSGGADAGVE